jgi:hypothetical protein
MLFAAVPPPLLSQRILSSIDLSATSLRYADSVGASGVSLNPSTRIDWGRGTLGAHLEISGLGGRNVTTQGAISPSVFTPSAGPFSAELSGTAGGSSHFDGTRTGQLLGLVRGYLSTSAAGTWIGAGSGATWDGSAWQPTRQGELGGWFNRNSVSAVATLTPVAVGDSTRYTDIQAALRYPIRMVELGVSAGVRTGASGSALVGSSRTWGMLSLVGWVAPRVAIVGAVGRYPVDPTQGYPGGQFVSLALRLSSGDVRAADRPGSHLANTNDAAASHQITAAPVSFEVRSLGGGRRIIRVAAPNATMVEINGDFTQWQPVRLTRQQAGVWTLTQSIGRGTYQVTLRIDGGRWMAPPGVLTTADEFGGVAGVLIIE